MVDPKDADYINAIERAVFKHGIEPLDITKLGITTVNDMSVYYYDGRYDIHTIIFNCFKQEGCSS